MRRRWWKRAIKRFKNNEKKNDNLGVTGPFVYQIQTRYASERINGQNRELNTHTYNNKKNHYLFTFSDY